MNTRGPGGTSRIVAGRWARDVLVVRGPDAVTYLQGQVSADVMTLEPGQSTLGLLLEPNGKLGVLLRLWRTDEHVFVIDTDEGAGDRTIDRLRRFLLRTEVSIDRLGWDCVAVRGPGSVELADRMDATGAELVGLGMWPGVDGLDLLGEEVSVPADLAPATPEELEVMRIRAGWPAYGAEIVSGVIPGEVGPWLITAGVSFTKGCYVGQELTTRINSRGNKVPRHLRTIELAAGIVAAPGDDVVVLAAAGDLGTDEGHELDRADVVGSVTSAAVDPRTGTTVALAYVKRSVPDDATLGVAGQRP